MKKLRKGGTGITTLLFVALTCSVALNVSFITGCKLVSDLTGTGHRDTPPPPSIDASQIRRDCMREAADAIGVKYAPGMTASEILSDIRMTVKPVSFDGNVLTEDEIKLATDSLEPAARTTLRENQKFLGSVKGKKMLLITPVR